jgi:hypothetical protein
VKTLRLGDSIEAVSTEADPAPGVLEASPGEGGVEVVAAVRDRSGQYDDGETERGESERAWKEGGRKRGKRDAPVQEDGSSVDLVDERPVRGLVLGPDRGGKTVRRVVDEGESLSVGLDLGEGREKEGRREVSDHIHNFFHRTSRSLKLAERGREGVWTHLHNSDNRSESLLAHDQHSVVNVNKNLRRNVGRIDLRKREEGLVDESLSALRDCSKERVR